MSDKKINDGTKLFSNANRFELIDDTGRVYVTYDAKAIEVQYQDQGRTVKVFVTKSEVARDLSTTSEQ